MLLWTLTLVYISFWKDFGRLGGGRQNRGHVNNQVSGYLGTRGYPGTRCMSSAELLIRVPVHVGRPVPMRAMTEVALSDCLSFLNGGAP